MSETLNTTFQRCHGARSTRLSCTRLSYIILAVAIFAVFANCYPVFAQDVDSDEDNAVAEKLFTMKVGPILKEKCLGCHGKDEDDIAGDFDVRSVESILKGGESEEHGMVIGDAESSLIVNAIQWRDLEMPPKENDRLTEEQVQAVREWIDLGAVWPSPERQAEIRKSSWDDVDSADGLAIETSGGQSDEWTYRRYKPEDVWAFQSFEKPEVPELADHPVDAFVAAKMAAAELNVKPASPAAPRTLIRRASFDLTGLPPKPEEIDAFVAAWEHDSKTAWTELIDRLLETPQYGERWAQHWLDVVRYADTSGFSNDYERSNAWRYRDYVVRSINSDKPYNRFIVEQIAGDELVAERETDKALAAEFGSDLTLAEARIAIGFLRMGPWEHTAMTPEKVSRQIYLDDVTNSVGQTFLSTPLRCCKCHDHKFDPIPTKDYYRVYSSLATTNSAEMPAEFLPAEKTENFDVEKKHVQALLDFAKQEQDALHEKRESAAKEWYEEKGIPDEYVPFQKRTQMGDNPNKPRRFVGLTTQEEGVLKVREQDVRIWTRRLERFEPLAQSVYTGGQWVQNSKKLRPPQNKKQKEKDAVMPESFIYEGGSVFVTGEKVTPGVMSCLKLPSPAASDDDPYAVPQSMSNRRITLARWIADEKNPLTTRSIVNRIWGYHFGSAIAGNPNNFGATGKKPTHPELLNWLAKEFVEQGWSLKKMHRLIMTSSTYMQATDHPDIENLKNADPNNELIAYFQPRRMSAEEMRDAMLASTGELNLDGGGLPCRPEINKEVAFAPRMIQFTLATTYQPNRTPAQRHRRSLYAYRVRGLPDPMLEVFNKPNSDESCEFRDESSVSPQVFALLNSDVMTSRSIAMAQRAEKEANDPRAQIARAYEITLGRVADDETVDTLHQHYEKMVEYHQGVQPEPFVYPKTLDRSVVEELSGEAVNYVERLDIYEDFIADTDPADVSPETRALADVCLLLFNSNQFVYIY